MRRIAVVCLLMCLLTLSGCGSNQTQEHALERMEAVAAVVTMPSRTARIATTISSSTIVKPFFI